MMIDIKLDCCFCGCEHTVGAKFEEFVLWRAGSLIQDAMPDLTPTEREQLISGICPKCQTEIFGE